jgi:hypothetical protein
MRKLFARYVVLAGLASPTLAFAQAAEPAAYPPCTGTPSEADVSAAQGLFAAGKTSFNEADYGRAITYWEDAYSRDCTAHLLLMNLARAYELNAQKDKALVALETYQQRNPGSAQDEALSKRIQKLREQITAERLEEQPAAAPSDVVVPAAPVVAKAPPPARPKPAAGGGKRSIAPLIVAGAGGALMIGGGIVWGGALADLGDIEDQCGNRDPCASPNASELVDDGNAARKRANISGAFAGVGVAALVGGVLWYFLQSPQTQAQQARWSPAFARWTPQVSRDHAGLDLRGQF